MQSETAFADTPIGATREIAGWFDICRTGEADRARVARGNAARLFGISLP
jgi:hypothetical protein